MKNVIDLVNNLQREINLNNEKIQKLEDKVKYKFKIFVSQLNCTIPIYTQLYYP